MAKIAVIFLLFALFAMAMAASVPESDPIAELRKQIDDNLVKLKELFDFNKPEFKPIADAAKDAGNATLKGLQNLGNLINEQLQKATVAPPTK
ncbi:neuropeptide-like 2 [Drosophila eugracilis]|uniref:neuropeptide-like 2 n=1 Tax=Drosophila eugracilis TaxID=29029 RepID=UPI0007E7A822|nr:neuropeptide-like 2 [Drosophila eugracilis]